LIYGAAAIQNINYPGAIQDINRVIIRFCGGSIDFKGEKI